MRGVFSEIGDQLIKLKPRLWQFKLLLSLFVVIDASSSYAQTELTGTPQEHRRVLVAARMAQSDAVILVPNSQSNGPVAADPAIPIGSNAVLNEPNGANNSDPISTFLNIIVDANPGAINQMPSSSLAE